MGDMEILTRKLQTTVMKNSDLHRERVYFYNLYK